MNKTLFKQFQKNILPFRIAFPILFILALTTFYSLISMQIPMNSDNASILLEAKDIVDGNILLKGWTLSTVTYYTTEMPFYIFGVLLFGFKSSLLYIVPSFIYALIIYLCIVIANQKFQVKSSLILLSFIGIPCITLSFFVLVGAIHMSAILFSLICCFFISKETKLINYISYVFFILLIAIGDNFMLYVFIIPLILTFTTNIVCKNCIKKNLILLSLTVLSVVLSKLSLFIIRSSGGFVMPEIKGINFVQLNDISNNIKLTISGLLNLYNANIFGGSISSLNTILSILHFLGMTVVFFAVYKTAKTWKSQSILMQVLIATCVFNILAYTFSNMPTNSYTARYLIPVFIFSVIICSQFSFNINPKIIIVICTCFMLSFIPQIRINADEHYAKDLANFLEKNQLYNGYGVFWCSNIVTVASDNVIKVRPIAANSNVYPMHWLSKDKWYTNYANFIVLREQDLKSISVIDTKIGKPEKTYEFKNYTILVWNKNITSLIN